MTERSESERAELASKLDHLALEFEASGAYRRTLNAAADALRRLATQDQKPYGWLIDRKIEPVFFTRSEIAADEYAGRGVNTTPVYLSPPPAADAPDHGGADAGVGVKPLEWIRSEVFGAFKWRGMGPFGEFSAFMEGYKTDEMIEVRKAQLQVEYERHILAALSKPAPVAANASAEVLKEQSRLIELAEEMDEAAALEVIRNGGRRLPVGSCKIIAEALRFKSASLVNANASAEARLLRLFKSIECATRNDFLTEKERLAAIRLFVAEALSTHPHASDCDKQGER